MLDLKDYEDGRKCLSPSIFRKSKGPIIFTASHTSITSNSNFEATVKGLAFNFKKQEGAGPIKEISLSDFDINQCADLTDVYRKNKLHLIS